MEKDIQQVIAEEYDLTIEEKLSRNYKEIFEGIIAETLPKQVEFMGGKWNLRGKKIRICVADNPERMYLEVDGAIRTIDLETVNGELKNGVWNRELNMIMEQTLPMEEVGFNCGDLKWD